MASSNGIRRRHEALWTTEVVVSVKMVRHPAKHVDIVPNGRSARSDKLVASVPSNTAAGRPDHPTNPYIHIRAQTGCRPVHRFLHIRTEMTAEEAPLPGNGMNFVPTDNSKLDRSFLDANIKDVVAQLSVQEKIMLLAGKDRWS